MMNHCDYKRLLLILVLLVPSPSWALVWPSEPGSSTPLMDCNFVTVTCPPGSMPGGGQLWDVFSSLSIVTDSNTNGSPSSAVRASLIYPSLNGGGELMFYRNVAQREMFVGLWLKVNPDWQQNIVGINKFMFMRAFNFLAGGTLTNGFFGVAGSGNPMTVMWYHGTGGTDNQHACGASQICYSNMGSGQIYFGQWHRVEACIRASTSPTSQDGVVAWVVDGVLAGKYTNINYGSGVVNEWAFAQTWDGGPNAQGRTHDVWEQLDHAYISEPPSGGCAAMGGGTPPPPPPPPVPPPPPPPPAGCNCGS